MKTTHISLVALFAGGSVVLPSLAWGHSVAQLQTAKRIAETTIVALDPQKGTIDSVAGTDTKARVGDVLTYVIQFTPVPNDASRGAGGYITEYVPPNTEVVGARFIDKDGNTVKPHRGPQMDDGWGPRGAGNYGGLGLEEGSLAQLYADTGIFFSTDERTSRFPNDVLIKVRNGYEFKGDQAAVIPEILALDTPYIPDGPTAASKLYEILTGDSSAPFYAHNRWDYIQALAYGVGGNVGEVVSDGNGNTPFGFGSVVAGPETYYSFEKVFAPACWDVFPAAGCASALDDDPTDGQDAPIGPWRRIRYAGSEIGTGAQCPAKNCASDFVRVGVPTDLGWGLSLDNPLPTGTNAVRFAVGELVVGEEYLVEISVRVKALPLDPNTNDDTNCAEVSGGDAAQPQNGQDNAWRYFAPAPSCVSLNLVFDLSVDKIVAGGSDTLTYTLRVKNLSTEPQTNVTVTSQYNDGKLDNPIMLGETPDPSSDANGVITWPIIPSLAAGEEVIYTWTMDTKSTDKSTVTSASYVSDEQTDPFTVLALTTLESITVFQHTATVTQPAPSATEGDVVTYTVTIANTGTGDALTDGADYIRVHLPDGVGYCDSADGCTDPTLDTSGGTGTTDPGWNATTQEFEDLVVIPPGESSTLTFQARVVDSTPDLSGIYTIDVQTQYKDNGIGRLVEKSTFDLAPLLINAIQSEAPMLNPTILAGATSVSGTTSEGAGATVKVFVNGNRVDEVTAGAGGAFTATVPTLFAGQRVTATATADGEVESDPSPAVTVEGTSAGSGPPAELPECADGMDNDGDGDADYPDDASCTSYLDDTEGNTPECEDGIDNDNDGDIDADDQDCQDGNSETGVPACADGIDNDDDGKTDYPTDPECSGPTDDDEEEGNVQTPGETGEGGAAGAGSDETTTGQGGSSNIEDLGGLSEPPETSPSGSSGDDSGCGCRVVGSDAPANGSPWGLLGFAFVGGYVSRRRRRAAS